MNINKSFWISRKISKDSRNKIIILIVICFIIVVSVFSFYKSIKHYLYYGIMKMYNYNYYFVTYSNTSDSLDEAILKLKSIEHIDDIFIDDYQLYSINIDSISSNKINGSFYLVAMPNEKVAEKIGISKKLNYNEIICPQFFYPNDNIEGNKFIPAKRIINLKNMLNTTFDLYYYKYINDYNSVKKNIKLNLISTYENNENIIDENICYSSRELIKNIFDDAYENVDLSNQYNSIIVLIDNQKFYTDVEKQISKLGYEVTSSFTLNENFFEFVWFISIFLIISSFVFVIILVSNLNKKSLNNNTNEYGIMRSIGANKSDIFKLLFVESMHTFLLSLFFSLTIFFVILFLTKMITILFPFVFSKIPIKVDYCSIIIFMSTILVILIFENIIYFRKLFSYEIMDNINE